MSITEYAGTLPGPLGGVEVNGTEITIDDLAGAPPIINETVRDLVAANQGYFVEDIFSTPGFTVQGGAILYTESFPQDHFLDPDQSLRPRAPGAEAPYIGALRRAPSVARPESLSGKFDIYDEWRRRNQVGEVLNLMRKVANTFADRMQARGMETLDDAITVWGREITSVSWADAASAAGGTINVARTTQPEATFAAVLKQFEDDKAGVKPDTAILSTTEAFNLRVIFGRDLQAFLDSYGISKLRSTPQLAAGKAIFAKGGQVGEIAFEKPLDTEEGRGPIGTFKDTYAVEGVPVFVARDASAVLRVAGLNA